MLPDENRVQLVIAGTGDEESEIDRLIVGAELNEPDVATFYAPGPVGYVDYPTMDAFTELESA